MHIQRANPSEAGVTVGTFEGLRIPMHAARVARYFAPNKTTKHK